MKYKNEEIKNVNHLAKILILSSIANLEDHVYQSCFGGLDIMNPIARQVLRDAEGFEISDLEVELLTKTLKFEIAKVIGIPTPLLELDKGMYQNKVTDYEK